jgi:hypothetical protein
MATDRPTEAPPADSCPQPEPQGPDDHRSRAETYADLRAADQRTADRSRDLRAGDERAVGSVSPADQRAADPTPLAGDAPHTTADGGWSWKSLRLNRADNQVADQQLAARRQAEGRHPDGTYDDRGLTPALRRVEGQLDHGTLIPDTEKFALKSPDRFKEKLAKMVERRPGTSVEDLADEISDGIRYTFLFDPDHYTDQTRKACANLTDNGYELMRLANRWGGEEYKGINSRWSDPGSGQHFEVQFHTAASWEAKQKTHEAYEKIDNPETPVEEVEELRSYQRSISDSLEVPSHWDNIRDYRKPGH